MSSSNPQDQDSRVPAGTGRRRAPPREASGRAAKASLYAPESHGTGNITEEEDNSGPIHNKKHIAVLPQLKKANSNKTNGSNANSSTEKLRAELAPFKIELNTLQAEFERLARWANAFEVRMNAMNGEVPSSKKGASLSSSTSSAAQDDTRKLAPGSTFTVRRTHPGYLDPNSSWGIPFKEGQTGTIPKIFDPVCGKDDDTEYENSPSPPPGPLAQERAPRVIDSFRKRMQ